MNHPLAGSRILISGAGVAGPALAYWLTRYGAETTVVEVAPTLRTSGFAVDFRGPTHLGVLSKMGVLDQLREIQTHGGAMSCVDEHDREIFRLPSEFAGGDIEVHRRDLSRVLYEAAADRTVYLASRRALPRPDVALVSAVKNVYHEREESGGLPTSGAYTMLMVKNDGEWRVALAQTTPRPAP